MKLQYTGSDFEAQRLWTEGSKDDFLSHIYEHTQVTHDLDEAIIVDTQGNMNLLTVYDSDGTVRVVGGESGDTTSPTMWCEDGQFEDGTRGNRRWKLEEVFDDVFLAAIESGLLVEKAVKKACEAVEGIEQIEAARNRVVNAQLDKEFGDVEN